ncbi:hypothetical protein ACJJTC_002142 [Scirpophaga incertulas]
MNRFLKERTIIRRKFTRDSKDFEFLLTPPIAPSEVLSSAFKKVSESSIRLRELNSLIFEQLLNTECDETKLEEEVESTDAYTDKWYILEDWIYWEDGAIYLVTSNYS